MILLSSLNDFDFLKEDGPFFYQLDGNIKDVSAGIYSILLVIGIIGAALSIMILAILLMLSRKYPVIAERKESLSKILFLMFIFFNAISIVSACADFGASL